MATFEDVPNELRLLIASYLPCHDLASLALLNKEFTLVAQEALHLRPAITQLNYGLRLMSLLQTLLAHPKLLEGLQSLSLTLVDDIIPFDEHADHRDVDIFVKSLHAEIKAGK
jgi:hypothetical protein